jgi:hypothetical protein
MNAHQGNQANASSIGTYQYQIGDQVLEIPSNINYQLENIIAAGGGVSSNEKKSVLQFPIHSRVYFSCLVVASSDPMVFSFTYKSPLFMQSDDDARENVRRANVEMRIATL